jgi:acyl-coenzyme A thioesterase PaaI-like protein
MPGFGRAFLLQLTPLCKCRIDAGMKEVQSYPGCFVCGGRNPHGLKARFFYDGERAITELTATEAFEGYKGIFHGGIVASLLDEVMIKAILARDVYAVTAEITVRYRLPIPTGERIRFVGKIISRKGRLHNTEGETLGPDGTLYASAVGTYLEARPDLKTRLLQSLE